MKINTPVVMLCLLTAIVCNHAKAQEGQLKKSWIKESIEEFHKEPAQPDTSYLRYVFESSTVLYGFEPHTNSMQMPFSRWRKTLTLGNDEWTIETLTDTTLTISLAGFRRIKFVAEEYLQTKQKYLLQIGEYKGKPLYKANEVITPRYKKKHQLVDDVIKQDRARDYNIRKAGSFLMTFIVTDDGKIEQPTILKSIALGFDNSIVKELQANSRYWTPAMFNGKPVQTLLTFEIQFLDSLSEY